jgi:hypothetical protein
MKSCRICKEAKPKIAFVKSKVFSDGIDTICLDCSRQKVKEWRKANPEKRKLQSKRESGKDYNHNKHLKATYGITRDEYLKKFTEQQGNCEICGDNQILFTKRLFVDHCHTSSKIRGLLCQSCNTLLGGAKDNKVILERAIKYLEKYHAAE